MRVSIFGLGYVGAVSAACLAADGNDITGVDKNASKVALLNEGKPPIVEAGAGELIAKAHGEGRLRATTDAMQAIAGSEISLVCVGTPSESNGSLDLRFVRNVCEEIGQAIGTLGRYHTVVIRSTILPGTMRTIIVPELERHSGKKAGVDFGVCFNPEFLREGTAVHDHYHPPKTVVGETDSRAGDQLLKLYAGLPGPVIRTSLETAEMVKYVDNTWHALKVGFANEIASLCKPLRIDSFEVMNIFCQDTKLNLSPYYLRPGYAFGGSCLPKDVRALRYRARSVDVELPIINAILPSNEIHTRRGIDLVMSQNKKRIGVLGFSFKAGTDDLRESPLVTLIEQLLGKGYDILIYDRNVSMARLTGANRDYILNHIPHISKLMRDRIDDVLDHAEVVVIGNADAEFAAVPGRLRPGQKIIDLVRVSKEVAPDVQYEGLCW
ncbi:MAG: UDP-glucose/GDP-mannose dehydrogenase family protein [Steroidobacteraceae bacterium]